LHIIGTSVTVLVTSSRIANISAEESVNLNFVLVDGRVFSYLLHHCGSLLSGMITIPSVEFEHQLEGSDTEGNGFITSVSTRAFTTIGLYNICIDVISHTSHAGISVICDILSESYYKSI